MRSIGGLKSYQDFLLFVGIALLLAAAGIWFALRFIHPSPPGILVLSAASKDSPYYQYAERYGQIFERNGVKLEIRESAGSFANLKALQDSNSGVQVGFVQGGIASKNDTEGLVSMGRVSYEPVWVFYSGSKPLTRLTELKGRRILVGPTGSGTNRVALQLLSANGITSDNTTLINEELPSYVDTLSKAEADAGFLILASDAKTIQRLLRTPNVQLMNLANADAYAQRFPFLTHLYLREGAVDFAADIPPIDTSLIATSTAVLARADTHPALLNLLAQALEEVHAQSRIDSSGELALFQSPGMFPTQTDPEFAFSNEAQRVYRTGPPILQRYVPFWVATTIDRLTLSLVVLLPILIPVMRFAPQLYSWRIRHRIIRWYGELRRLEIAARGTKSADERASIIPELERIEGAVDKLPVPLDYADQLYELRQHIDLTRRRLS